MNALPLVKTKCCWYFYAFPTQTVSKTRVSQHKDVCYGLSTLERVSGVKPGSHVKLGQH